MDNGDSEFGYKGKYFPNILLSLFLIWISIILFINIWGY